MLTVDTCVSTQTRGSGNAPLIGAVLESSVVLKENIYHLNYQAREVIVCIVGMLLWSSAAQCGPWTGAGPCTIC